MQESISPIQDEKLVKQKFTDFVSNFKGGSVLKSDTGTKFVVSENQGIIRRSYYEVVEDLSMSGADQEAGRFTERAWLNARDGQFEEAARRGKDGNFQYVRDFGSSYNFASHGAYQSGETGGISVDWEKYVDSISGVSFGDDYFDRETLRNSERTRHAIAVKHGNVTTEARFYGQTVYLERFRDGIPIDYATVLFTGNYSSVSRLFERVTQSDTAGIQGPEADSKWLSPNVDFAERMGVKWGQGALPTERSLE